LPSSRSWQRSFEAAPITAARPLGSSVAAVLVGSHSPQCRKSHSFRVAGAAPRMLRGNLANEEAVQLVLETFGFALGPAPDAAIFSVTVDGRTSKVRHADGHLVHSGDLPTSLPVRIFMASVAEAIEAQFGASMCGGIALDGTRAPGQSCQQSRHRETARHGQLSATVGGCRS
jgi:hypothetical protein